jgi:hypothetical protein
MKLRILRQSAFNFLRSAAVGQNTFGRQQVVELTGKGYPQLQQALEAIKAKGEAAR